MKYSDLKDDIRVYVFIPEINRFVRMEVTERVGDEKGGFTISNYDTGDLIEGHSHLAIIRNQNDLDSFFYVHNGNLTVKNRDIVTQKAIDHFNKNGKNWIY